jgi:hypothetical protein
VNWYTIKYSDGTKSRLYPYRVDVVTALLVQNFVLVDRTLAVNVFDDRQTARILTVNEGSYDEQA